MLNSKFRNDAQWFWSVWREPIYGLNWLIWLNILVNACVCPHSFIITNGPNWGESVYGRVFHKNGLYQSWRTQNSLQIMFRAFLSSDFCWRVTALEVGRFALTLKRSSCARVTRLPIDSAASTCHSAEKQKWLVPFFSPNEFLFTQMTDMYIWEHEKKKQNFRELVGLNHFVFSSLQLLSIIG